MRQGKLFLIHWHSGEAENLAEALRAAGWSVDVEAVDGGRAVKRILSGPPSAVLVYLKRLPSHGRETALALRSSKAGRAIPVIFVDGEAAKVENARLKFPEAVFTTSERLEAALKQAVAGLDGN